MKLFLSFILIFTFSLSFISCDDSTGDKTYGDSEFQYGYSVQETSNGGAIIAGSSGNDFYVLKVDSSGDIEWSKTEGGDNAETAYGVKETSDGGFVVVASTESYGPGDPENYGSYGNIFIQKYSSSGTKVWGRIYGYNGYEGPRDLKITEDGGFIIAGYTHTFGNGNFYVLKLDVNGNKEWDNNYGTDRIEVGYAISVVPGNGYIVAGNTIDESGRAKGYIVKIDNSGDEEWSSIYGNSDIFYMINSIITTSNGGYIAAGNTSTDIFPNSSSNAWILKINSSGFVEWDKTFGGNNLERAHDVVAGVDGGYVFVGETRSYGNGNNTESDAWLVKISVNGVMVWSKTYGGTDNDIARSLAITDAGGYIFAGETMTGFADGYDIFLVKVDANGVK
jgi:hypothetical protein